MAFHLIGPTGMLQAEPGVKLERSEAIPAFIVNYRTVLHTEYDMPSMFEAFDRSLLV